jgi:hypothetical protein
MFYGVPVYSYRLIGKLTAFFAVSGVQSTQFDRGYFHFRRASFSSILKSKCDNILVKSATLRINLNLDGSSITSKSHAHPSHSQTSRLLMINLVSISRCSSSTTNPVCVRRVNSLVLVCSLSSHRHSYIHLIFNSRCSVCKRCRFLIFSF